MGPEGAWYYSSGAPSPLLASSTTAFAFSSSVFLPGPPHSHFPGLKYHLSLPAWLLLSGGADSLLHIPSTEAAGTEQQDRKGRHRAQSPSRPAPHCLSLLVGHRAVTQHYIRFLECFPGGQPVQEHSRKTRVLGKFVLQVVCKNVQTGLGADTGPRNSTSPIGIRPDNAQSVYLVRSQAGAGSQFSQAENMQ